MNKSPQLIMTCFFLLFIFVYSSFAKPQRRPSSSHQPPIIRPERRPTLPSRTEREQTPTPLESKPDEQKIQPILQNSRPDSLDKIKGEKSSDSPPKNIQEKPSIQKPKSEFNKKKQVPQENSKPPKISPLPLRGQPAQSPGRKPVHPDFRGHEPRSSHRFDDRKNHLDPPRFRGSSNFDPFYPRLYYDSWIVMHGNSYYPTDKIPEQVRIQMNNGNKIEFSLEENGTTSYQWFASYNAFFCRIVIEHQQKKNGFFMRLFGSSGTAVIQIEAINTGETMVELLYARPWELERGFAPAKRIQVFLEISPD